MILNLRGRDLKRIDDWGQSILFSHDFSISFEGLLLRCCFSFFRRLLSRLIRGGEGGVARFHDWNADAESFDDSFSLKRIGRLEILNSEISSFSPRINMAIDIHVHISWQIIFAELR